MGEVCAKRPIAQCPKCKSSLSRARYRRSISTFLLASSLSLQNQGINGDRKEKPMVHMAWTASQMVDNDYIWWSSFDGNAWSPQTPFPDGHSSSSPALADGIGQRYMAWKGRDNQT